MRRSNQKGIVLGEKGRTLRAARRQSEAELRGLFDEQPQQVQKGVALKHNYSKKLRVLQRFSFLYCHPGA